MAFPTIVPGSTPFHKRSQAHKSRIDGGRSSGCTILVQCENEGMNRAACPALLRRIYNDLGLPLRDRQ
jgi:hypothetical protein